MEIAVVVVAVVVLIIICIFSIVQIRNNNKNLKMKTECGETIGAKVISWKEIPGRPNRYVIKAEYEVNQQKVNKTFMTSRRFAKRYEHDRDIQIVVIPNSNKAFLEEEDWKVQNVMNYFFLIFSATFLLDLLIMGLLKVFIS